jgi:hypothetical protein
VYFASHREKERDIEGHAKGVREGIWIGQHAGKSCNKTLWTLVSFDRKRSFVFATTSNDDLPRLVRLPK